MRKPITPASMYCDSCARALREIVRRVQAEYDLIDVLTAPSVRKGRSGRESAGA